MTTRTFKQFGQGYGSTPTSISVTLDGVEIFSGTVNTQDEPFPSLPDTDVNYGSELFSWTDDVTFVGTKTLSIAVTGSPLLLTDSKANYGLISDPLNPGQYIPGGPDEFTLFFIETIDGVAYSDPFTNEAIDEIPQEGPPNPDYVGQWYWLIPSGSTFTATINVQAGTVPPTP